MTETLLGEGADIILPVAGPVGLGAAAARSLLELIEDTGLAPSVSVLPVELVVRESCGAAKEVATT